jgi:hypothetical protein
VLGLCVSKCSPSLLDVLGSCCCWLQANSHPVWTREDATHWQPNVACPSPPFPLQTAFLGCFLGHAARHNTIDSNTCVLRTHLETMSQYYKQ